MQHIILSRKFLTKENFNKQQELIIKISISEKIKTIDKKFEKNKAQYTLDRQTA